MKTLRRSSRSLSEESEKLHEKVTTLEKSGNKLSSRVSIDGRLGSKKGNANMKKEEWQYEQLKIAEKIIHSRVENSMSIHIRDDLLKTMQAEDGSRSHAWAIEDRPRLRVKLMKGSADHFWIIRLSSRQGSVPKYPMELSRKGKM